MKKILFITQSYPSKRSANVICDKNIIEELTKCDGYSVHCLTSCFNGQKNNENYGLLKVYRFKISLLSKIIAWADGNKKSLIVDIIKLFKKMLLRIKQFIFIPIYPCYQPLLSHVYARQAIKYNKKEHFDMVITEYHGYETLYAGYRLKKKYKDIIFIPIFWDSFSGGMPSKYFPVKIAMKLKLKQENKICSVADKIIFMESSKNHHTNYNITKKWYKNVKYLSIPYLFNKIEISNKQKGKTVTITYAGLVNYPLRNIPYALLLAKELLDEVEFVFIGMSNCQQMFSESLPNVRYHSFVSHEKLCEYLIESDVFLNMGVKTPCAISGKIFEYMSYGKPIISTYSIDNEASIPYLKKYPLSLLLDERESDIKLQANQILEFIENTKNKKVDFNELESIFYNNTPQAYVDVIENELSV
jgi:hypothetical protein